MMKHIVLTAAAALMLVSTSAISAGDAEHPKELEWSFDGVMGKVDKPSAQRGYQVYKEVCSSCHAMKRIAYRSLTEIGFSEAEVKALAATYTYTEIGDDGEPKERPDHCRQAVLPKAPIPKLLRRLHGRTRPRTSRSSDAGEDAKQ